MQANYQEKYAEQKNTRHETPKLDDRYGKIGISAVAAAIRFCGHERSPDRARRIPHERD